MLKNQLNMIGIWLGFNNPTPLKREGIGRFSVYLTKHLLKNYPLRFEVWCYSLNLNEVRELFGELLKDARYNKRIEIKTERDFREKSKRKDIFIQAIKPINRILIYGHAVSWREPYRVYRTNYNLSLKKRREKAGESVNVWTYFLYLPMDLIASTVLILGGIISRLIRNILLRDMIFTEIETEKYAEIKGADLASDTGKVTGDSRVCVEGDKKACIVYGPYIKLPLGFYKIRVEYSSEGNDSEVIGYWDIAFDHGKKVVRSGEIRSTGDGIIEERMWVDKEHELLPMEVRLRYNGTGRLEVKKLEIFHNRTKDEKEQDTLAKLANRYSQADCFLVPIVTLYNSLEIDKQKLITIHDLVHFEFYDYFLKENKGNDLWMAECQEKIDKFAAQGCFFCSNSDYVRKNHVLKYINNAEKKNAQFVYLPVNYPDSIKERVLMRNEILKKYNVKNNYIFYPSQIRPYKNLITLLKSFKILLNKNINIDLVLTGNPNDSPLLKRYINDNEDLKKYIILTGDVPEIDLYSLHKYALATVVPTLFEGGFPWQGLEAMLMDTPAIMSKIPVTIERLKFNGFDPENCGLKLFDPENAEELASRVLDVMKDREKAVLEQSGVKEKLFSYTWDDVSRQYYKLFTELLSRNENRNEHKFPYSARQENNQNK